MVIARLWLQQLEPSKARLCSQHRFGNKHSGPASGDGPQRGAMCVMCDSRHTKAIPHTGDSRRGWSRSSCTHDRNSIGQIWLDQTRQGNSTYGVLLSYLRHGDDDSEQTLIRTDDNIKSTSYVRRCLLLKSVSRSDLRSPPHRTTIYKNSNCSRVSS